MLIQKLVLIVCLSFVGYAQQPCPVGLQPPPIPETFSALVRRIYWDTGTAGASGVTFRPDKINLATVSPFLAP